MSKATSRDNIGRDGQTNPTPPGILRPLTAFETGKLDRLRVQFSGMPDLAELLVETELEMLTLPVPPACPSWCTLPTGHAYIAGRDAAARFHEWNVDNTVSVNQEERRTDDGTVTFGTAFVAVDRDDEVTAAGADSLAAALTEAAAVVRQIGGAA